MASQRTNQEKRQQIADMLRAMPHRSNRWIADQLHVSDNTVRSVRGELEKAGTVLPVRISVGEDGKFRPATMSGREVQVLDETPKWLLDRLHEKEHFAPNDLIDRPSLGPGEYKPAIDASHDYDKSALLMPLDFLAMRSANPQDILFSRLKAVYVIRRPILFRDQPSPCGYAWFVWEKSAEGVAPTIGWID